MITLSIPTALLHNEYEVNVDFEASWLRAALDRAARRAGYEGWWLLDEFSATVAQYLMQSCARKPIDLPYLERVVRSALRDIGYREIAARFRTTNPFQQISLVGFLGVRNGKPGSVFFKRLEERIQKLHSARVQHFHFFELQSSVQRLLGQDACFAWWSEPLMKAHVVGFIRERLRRLPWPSKIYCSIR